MAARTTTSAGAPLPEHSDPGRLLFATLVEFLREDGWPVAAEDEQERALAVTVEGTNSRWICAGQITEERPLLLFSSIVPAFVPPAARDAVGEFVTRANVGMLSGGFQYNLDEGEVRFVNSLDLGGVDPGPLAGDTLTSLVRQMVYVNVATTDRYLSALMSVIHTGADPAGAVAGAEQGD